MYLRRSPTRISICQVTPKSYPFLAIDDRCLVSFFLSLFFSFFFMQVAS